MKIRITCFNNKTSFFETYFTDMDHNVFRNCDDEVLVEMAREVISANLKHDDYSVIMVNKATIEDFRQKDIKVYADALFKKYGINDTTLLAVMSRARRNVQIHMDMYYEQVRHKTIPLAPISKIKEYPLTVRECYKPSGSELMVKAGSEIVKNP